MFCFSGSASVEGFFFHFSGVWPLDSCVSSDDGSFCGIELFSFSSRLLFGGRVSGAMVSDPV